MTETGRVCGTSASSAPSVTTSWTPSASASSTITLLNAAPAERRLAAGQQDQVARRARDPRLVELDRRATRSARVWPSTSLIAGTRGLEVVELLGIDRREPPRAERAADERDRRRRGVGGVVPALERADQRRGPQTVGAVLPLQAAASGSPYIMGGSCLPTTTHSVLRSARSGPARRSIGVFACTRKDRLTDAHGLAVSGARAARPHGHDPGARVPRRRRAGRALRARRSGAGRRQGRALPRRAGRRGARDRARGARRRGRRPGALPAHAPTATSTSSTASSSTSPARSTTARFRALLDGAAGATRRAARRLAPRALHARGGHHAYLGGLLEHTVAVATLASRGLPAAPAAELRSAADAPRSSTTSAARASSPTAPRSASPRRGGCSATW